MASTPSSTDTTAAVATAGARIDLQRAVALAFLYFLLAWLALRLTVVEEAVPVIAPATGVAVGALVIYGRRLVFGALVGALGAYLASGIPLMAAVPLSLGAALTALAGAWLLASAPDFRPTLARGRDVFAFVCLAVVGAPLAGASIGLAALLTGGLVPADDLAATWLSLWDSEALGVLIVAPAVFGWVIQPRPGRRTAVMVAYAALVAFVLLFGAHLFSGLFGESHGLPIVAFVLAPLAVLPAIRLALREIATFNLGVAVLCVAGISIGGLPLAEVPVYADVVMMQAVLTALAVLTLSLSATGESGRAAHARMRESEARFRSLTEMSADWYWEMNDQLRFTSISGSVESTTGVRPDELIGRTRWEMDSLTSDDGSWDRHRADLEAHRPFRDFPVHRELGNGTVRHALLSGDPVLDDVGRFRGYRGVGRDVTDQVHAEQALRESGQLFAHLFHSSPQAMALTRVSDQIVTEVNEAWCQLMGLPREEAIGRTLAELDLMEDPQVREFAFRELAARGFVKDVEVRFRARDGRVAEVLLSASLVEVRGERCVVGSLVDVTQRNIAERELRESRGRLEAILRSSPQPLALSAFEDGRIIDVNDAWVRTFGYLREDFLGQSFADIGLWVDLDQRARMYDELRANGSVNEVECRWRKRSGEVVDVLFSGECAELGGETVLLSSCMDVTERKRAERLLQESEYRFAKIFHASPVPVVISMPEDGRFIEVNEAWSNFFGYRMDAVVGRTSVELGIWGSETDRAEFAARVAGGGRLRNYEYRMRKQSGELADVLVSTEVIDLMGEERLLTSVMDITDLKRIERQLQASERRFRDFAEAAGEYVWETDVDGRYTYLSRRVEQVLGYAREEMYGRKPTEFMPPDEAEQLQVELGETIAKGEPFRNIELRSLTRSGSLVWQLVSGVPIRDELGLVRGYRGTAMEITERKRAERRIEELATRDPLTGLPNRLLLADRLSQGLLAAQRGGDMLGVLFVDLDHFKNINDTLGHQAGDLLLKEVAQRLGGVVRKGDTLSRQGGDEFVVVLEGLKTPDDAGQVAQKVLNALALPCEIEGHKIVTSGSVGIAIYPSDGADGPTLMRHADTAMYAAKSSGRKNYQFFSADMNLRTTERLQLEEAMRGALDRGELRVFFQPRVDITTGRLTGAEALLRWAHPEHGLVGPDRFMRVLEETGLIHNFGEWVLQQACNHTKAWNALHGPPFAIAVNISPKQFNQALIGRVSEALQTSGLEPELLEIEVTERSLTRHIEDSRSLCRKLRELGVRIVVDDFGTGYSSMSELRRLGVHAIKIDRSFVRLMGTSQDDRVVVRAIIDMARSLQLDTIAEGVERESELHLLRDMGCNEYMGNLLLPAVPASEFERVMLRTASIFAFPRRG
jgi:diguanylate cyclase (GGDEF)-like protein/PAS domain S-box-containing protein